MSLFLANKIGQNAALCHLGTINVAFALQYRICRIVFVTKHIGGTNQLLQLPQSCVKQSTASDPVSMNRELYLSVFRFLHVANLSISVIVVIWTPALRIG